MKAVRKTVRPVGFLMAMLMLLISGPFQSALAAMVPTETVFDSARVQDARGYLQQLLAREDVRRALVNQGIDPNEARARIDSLSDAEAVNIAGKLDRLPAGGGFFEALLIVALIVFLVLLITDIAGYTDIFPFVKSKK